MNINSTYQYNSFKATKIATAKNTVGRITTNIDIYKIGKEDSNFLKKLVEKINYKELFPKLDSYSIERWQHIFKYCIRCALNSNYTTYLTVTNNKPCGILSYTENGNELYLDGICSIPIEKNKKVNFGGTTLFYQIFKDAKEENYRGITLDAVNNGPFNVVSKYEKFGFKKDPTTYPYTKMICNKHKIAEQLKEIPYSISYKTINEEKVNLNKFLD